MHILINDFIGGYLDRGMPLYVRNLIDGLREEKFQVTVLRAPAFCRRLPRTLFYVLAVAFEQTVPPLLGLLLRADLTLYPYNSVALVDLVTKRGRIVVHDLEQLNRPASLSKAYYLVCYGAIKWLHSPIFTISRLSRQRLVDSNKVGRGTITILPNTFYAFERLLGLEQGEREAKKSVLLCTGSTPNKDLETVVTDYLPKVLARGFRISVLGLHKASDAQRLAALDQYLRTGQLRLCGQLSDGEVAAEYRKYEIVWVHSRREGFGRCVVEGRLAGCRVICSNIEEFAELRDADVHLYDGTSQFMATLEQLADTVAPIGPYTSYAYRDLLRNAIKHGL